MFYPLLFIYILVLSVPFWGRKSKDYFSPVSLFSILLFINTVPFMVIAFTDKYIVTEPVLQRLGGNYNSLLQIFMVNQILFNICYFFGYYRTQYSSLRFFDNTYKENKLLLIYSLLAVVPLLYTISFISSMGGVEGLLGVINDRTTLMEDRTIIFILCNFAIYLAGAFHIKYMSVYGVSKLQLFLDIFIAFVVLSSQGGRSPFILYLINIAVCYNYFISKLNLFSIKLVPFYMFVVGFVIGMYVLRTSKDAEISTKVVSDNLSVFVSGNSYVDIQLLIIDFFKNADHWMGESFKGLFGIFIPRSLYPDKLPIDEGVFVHEMIYSYQNVFRNKDFYISYPPSTIGIMYANFSYLGICIGGLILGYIHKKIYSLFTQSKGVLIAYIYVFTIIKFQITVFYIANLCYIIVLLFLFKIFLRSFEKRSLQQI